MSPMFKASAGMLLAWACVSPAAADAPAELTPGYGVSDYFVLDAIPQAGILPEPRRVPAVPRFTGRFTGDVLELRAGNAVGGRARIVLRDVRGRGWPISADAAPAGAPWSVALPGLPDGVYYLQIELEKGGSGSLLVIKMAASGS